MNQPISKVFYFSMIIGLVAVGGFVASIGAIVAETTREVEMGVSILVLGILISLCSGIPSCIVLYRLWDALQLESPRPRTTPGKAIGFLFIPFFNLYWIFQAYHGWAVDYNKVAVARGASDIKPVSEGVALAYSILIVCSCIPCLGYLAGIASVVLYFIFLYSAIDAANNLILVTESQSEF